MPECAGFLRTHQVSTPAKDFFTSLRRYPSNRGEVESSMRGLRAALAHTRQAAHAICQRLVKLKVQVHAIMIVHALLYKHPFLLAWLWLWQTLVYIAA